MSENPINHLGIIDWGHCHPLQQTGAAIAPTGTEHATVAVILQGIG